MFKGKIAAKTKVCAGLAAFNLVLGGLLILMSFSGPFNLTSVYLGCFYLCIHPLPFLISNCLNLPFGTEGRSGKQESVHNKELDTEKSFIQKPRVLLGFSAENLFT